ncbi:hypothetical protein RFI_06628 [Reticulomyxa filosa]|uniref:Uncharacterized protein n=1 Tax=Reticulomyxa filosa TaxID=46433 RepID=X6NWX9_RETFI|nr:hypothetical protein RFI_06628 [Reticulomyxa filosa]|eukprot:ETO30491.1 hypothetical protein RFI_06628 [Reticulomyxa filosa]
MAPIREEEEEEEEEAEAAGTEVAMKSNKMTTSQSFSEFAWSALKDLSLPQALESSQTYIQSHLRNFNTVYSLQPQQHPKHKPPRDGEQDATLSFTSPSLSGRSSRRASKSRRRSSTTDSRTKSDSVSSDGSMSRSLLENILDDYDQMLMSKTTDDGFTNLSQNKKGNKQAAVGEAGATSMTTDDGMYQLACDSMKTALKRKVSEDERRGRGDAGEVHGQSITEDMDDGEGDEGCVRTEELHRLSNQRMLQQFDLHVTQSNAMPGFMFSGTQQ